MARKIIGKKPKQSGDLLSRRSVMGGIGASLVMGTAVFTPGKARAAVLIRFADDGGLYGDLRQKAFLEPFMKKTGIEVRRYIGQRDLAKMKAMQLTGNLEYDVVCDAGALAAAAAVGGFLEPLDKSRLDLANYTVPEWATDYTISMQYYVIGIGYHEETMAGKPLPETWADFFDAEKFPGRRALLARPNDTLEAAAMADGVAPKDLYPLDLDRAYAALDRVKPNVQVWMDDTGESIEHLQRKEVDFSMTASGRVEASRAAGVPLAFIYDLPLAGPQNISIMKGASNYDECIALINHFVSDTESGIAYFTNAIGFAPLDRRTYDGLPDDIKAKLTDPANPKAAWTNPAWWGENMAAVTERHKFWLLQ